MTYSGPAERAQPTKCLPCNHEEWNSIPRTSVRDSGSRGTCLSFQSLRGRDRKILSGGFPGNQSRLLGEFQANDNTVSQKGKVPAPIEECQRLFSSFCMDTFAYQVHTCATTLTEHTPHTYIHR